LLINRDFFKSQLLIPERANNNNKMEELASLWSIKMGKKKQCDEKKSVRRQKREVIHCFAGRAKSREGRLRREFLVVEEGEVRAVALRHWEVLRRSKRTSTFGNPQVHGRGEKALGDGFKRARVKELRKGLCQELSMGI